MLHVENVFSPTTQASGFAAGRNRAGYWDRLLIQGFDLGSGLSNRFFNLVILLVLVAEIVFVIPAKLNEYMKYEQI